jgi:hypothetical protein
MPAWYDQAQQNIVNKATTASGNMPALNQTVAGGAISNLSGPNNPFMNAQQTLGQIGYGAANPFLTNPTTGQVTPNTQTAMGGLFQAQNQQLNQLLPNYTAAPMAAGIGSGNYGSLRGQTAVDKAKADAFANLNAAQMQAALQNQANGVNAATGLGQVGSAGTTSMLGLGQAQQSDPFMAASNLGKIVGGIQAPTTTKNTTQLSPLNTLGSLLSAGSAGYSAVDKATNGALGNVFKNLFSSGPQMTIGGKNYTLGNPISGVTTPGLGQITGPDGKVYADPTYGTPGSTNNSAIYTGSAPEGAIGPNGQPNPGWTQDESGNWMNLGTSGNQTPVDTSSNIDSGYNQVDNSGQAIY